MARAKAGGEIGANGEHYAGGQFIATSETTVKGMTRSARAQARRRSSRVQIEPRVYAVAPDDSMRAIFVGVGYHLQLLPNGELAPYEPAIEGLARVWHTTPEAVRTMAQDEADRYNRGERWIKRDSSWTAAGAK